MKVLHCQSANTPLEAVLQKQDINFQVSLITQRFRRHVNAAAAAAAAALRLGAAAGEQPAPAGPCCTSKTEQSCTQNTEASSLSCFTV